MKKISLIIINALLLFIPLFFLTITSEFYDINKQTLLYIGIVILLIVILIDYIKTKTVNISLTTLNVPVALLALASVITLFLNSPNKMESMLFPLGTGTMILLVFWFFILVNKIEVAKIAASLDWLITSLTLLAAIALFQYLKIGLNLFSQQSWATNQLWNPTGSPLTLALLMPIGIPYVVFRIIEYFNSKKSNKNNPEQTKKLVSYIVALTLLVVTTSLLGAQLLTKTHPILLPVSIGWPIAAEMLKGGRTALLGVGLLNYISAFTGAKPLSINSLNIWNINFTASSNYYLQLLTELGILGFGLYLIIIWRISKRTIAYVSGIKKKVYQYNPVFLSILIGLVIILVEQLLFPSSFLQLFVEFTLLAFFAKMVTHKQYTENSKIVFYILSTLIVIIVLASAPTAYAGYVAETYTKKGIDALAKNQAQAVLDNQVMAVKTNPYIDRYHVLLSQTSLAIAVSLSQKKDLTEAEKGDVVKQLSQAANEAKTAVALNPASATNWENLANVYKAMIGAVKEADVWTVQAYQEAITRNPANPNLYLSLGGIFYGAKNYDTAIRFFSQAVNLKRDYANAHYNLAMAYKDKKDFANAAAEMKVVISLVPANSPDMKKAEESLDEINKNIPTSTDQSQNEGELQPANQNDNKISTPVDEQKLNNVAPDSVINKNEQPKKATPAPSASPTQ